MRCHPSSSPLPLPIKGVGQCQLHPTARAVLAKDTAYPLKEREAPPTLGFRRVGHWSHRGPSALEESSVQREWFFTGFAALTPAMLEWGGGRAVTLGQNLFTKGLWIRK